MSHFTTQTLCSRRAAALPRRQAGLTLVELMVALALGLLVAAAAVASLVVARQGFTSTDSSTQLRENARFAVSLMQRIADQGGFQDVAGGQFPLSTVPPPALQGYDNALILPAPPTALTWGAAPVGLTHGSRTSANCGVTDTSCMNGSDILIIRYWGVSDPPGPGNPADGSMVNCSGGKEPERAAGPSYSIFSVVRSSSGEPTLACTYQDAAGAWQTVPLVTGVEGFQVLYGTTNNVTAGACSAAAAASAAADLTVLQKPMDTYLRAAQMDGPGGTYCAINWQSVRQIRIGLLVRALPGTAVAKAATQASYPVLAAVGATYPFSAAADVGSTLAVPADGRLRQQMAFTIQLHNLQQTRP